MVKAEDLDKYYRIPCDNRDLNYDQFFHVGSEIISQAEEYHSHNTTRLNEDKLSNLLKSLPEIVEEISLLK